MMKKTIYTFFAACIMSASVNAQLPNPGFETWTSMGSYENPDGWATLNDYTTVSGIYTATKGTPGSPGSFYLKLTSQTIGPGVVNGIAVSGTMDPATQQPLTGFPFTQQPASFNGKWQHMIYGSSQGAINVTLTRWDVASGSRVVVANANKPLTGMAMSWANFSIPFVYVDSQAPDTCIIVMKASGNNPTQNDYLWVDNLSFVGNVAGVSEATNLQGISLFPNPVDDQLTIQVETKTAENLVIEVYSLTGALLMQQEQTVNSGSNQIPLDLSALSTGNYLIQIGNGDQKSVLSVSVR